MRIRFSGRQVYGFYANLPGNWSQIAKPSKREGGEATYRVVIKIQLGWEMWRNLPTAEWVLILIGSNSEAETRSTNNCLLIDLGGDRQCSVCARGGEGITPCVFFKSDAPRGWDNISDDRKGSIHLGPDSQADGGCDHTFKSKISW